MSSKIKLLFCGDFLSQHPEEIIFSKELLSFFSKSNIRCINFEAPIENKGMPINKGSICVLSQSKDSPAYLESIGFNVITMSNNHIYDYGECGLIDTQNAFKSALTVGVGTWDTAYQVKVVELGNIKIGFLSLSHCEFGVLNDVWDKTLRIGCAGISYPKINSIIINTKKEVDYIFISVHAGVEYLNVPLPEWRNRYRELIDCGADAVIASHPHVPQGWEDYKGRPIFYSLGNFYLDMASSKPYWNNSLIVLLEIDTLTNTISYQVECTVRKDNRLEISNSKEMKNHVQYLYDILQEDDAYIKELECSLMKLYKDYKYMILSGLNLDDSSISPKNILKIIYNSLHRTPNFPVFLNLIRCESHLWALRRIIRMEQRDLI